MFKSIDLHIDGSENLFLKKSNPNIYSIFLDMEDAILKYCEFKNLKIEFHLHYDKGNVYFTRYINYKTGRTIISCVKEMIRFLKSWRVDGMGHFVVWV